MYGVFSLGALSCDTKDEDVTGLKMIFYILNVNQQNMNVKILKVTLQVSIFLILYVFFNNMWFSTHIPNNK